MGSRITSFLISLTMLGAFPGTAFGVRTLGDIFKSPSNDASKAIVPTCRGGNAQQNATCRPCASEVQKWKDKFPDIAQKAAAKDTTLTAQGTAGVNAGAANVTSSPLSAFGGAGGNAKLGKGTQTERQQNATDAGKEFKQCSEDIQQACERAIMPDLEKAGPRAMIKACDEAAAGAGEVAADAKKSGDSMGDMGKMMDMAGKALGMAGQLAQMMQQKGDQGASNPNSTIADNGGSTSPTPNGTNGTETSKDGSGASTASPSVGFSMPGGPIVASSSSPSDGGTAASSPVPARDPASMGGSPLGSGGTGGSMGAAGGGGGASGGGSGGSNSTGASKPVAADDAKKDDSNYEISGGGGKAMVGLKPTKGDLDALADASLTPPPATLDGAALPAAGAAPPADAASEDANASDGESIFKRVRTKYSLLKGAGRL